MKIRLFARPDAEGQRLAPLLDRFFPDWRMADAGLEGADMVLSYGGDGTFLECVRRVGERGLPILGINSGRLGFLANVPMEGVEEAFTLISAGNYQVESRLLLQAEGTFGEAPDFPFAFNEFSLHRGGAEMIGVGVEVDGEPIATIWGDGVLVATPSGSTAYALSVGGPVIAPECDCLIVAPIAPHNLSMRPVVVPAASRITLRVHSRRENPYATLDNRTFPASDGATFTLRRAGIATRLVRLLGHSFYTTLQEKMAWGIDKRAIFAGQ